MTGSRTTVLVTDGEERAALAVVRSLGLAGYDVYVCAPRAHALAASSRFCRGAAATPSPLRQPEEYEQAVASLLERWRVRVLLPVSEQSLRVLLAARFERVGVHVPFPRAEAFTDISDKAELLRRCARFDLAVPAQEVLHSAAELEQVEPRLVFPVVVKPTRSVVATRAGSIKTGVTYAADPAVLRARLRALPSDVYPVLLQERIVGSGSGVFVLVWDGELRAAFAHRRLREKPPAGGVSVYSESVALHPRLVEQAVCLLKDFGWQGVAMLEFKTDARTGRPYLMEINGRFWGSLQLAVDAGVDFPAILVACALGERPAWPSYRIGVRNRWWWGDVDHMLARLRNDPDVLGLPPGAPSRWQAVRDFLWVWRPGDRNEVLRLSDPWPFVRETIDWLRQV